MDNKGIFKSDFWAPVFKFLYCNKRFFPFLLCNKKIRTQASAFLRQFTGSETEYLNEWEANTTIMLKLIFCIKYFGDQN